MEHNNDMTMEKMMMTRAARNQYPINGSLELLPLCNMNCDMCYVRLDHNEVEKRGGLHSVEEWIDLAKQMADAGVLFLLLTGGEPLLFPGFKKLYMELKNLGMILTINTNGTLIDEEWADFFAKNRPRRINITLYGSDDTAYETLCHYPGGFEKTRKAIRLLREREIEVKINGSVTKENWKDVDAIYKIGKELDAPVHMDTYMLPGIKERNLPFEQQSRLNPEDAALAEIQTRKAEIVPEIFRQYAEQMTAILKKQDMVYSDQISCLAGNCSFTINWQGEMRPCVTLEEPSVPVFETGFLSAWQKISSESKTFHYHKKCTTCPYRPVCKICVASAYLETGSYDGIPEYLCRYAEEYARLLQKELE